VACTHLELIGWLKALSNLWHGFAAVLIGEIPFFLTQSPKTKAEIPGTNAEICGPNAEIHGMKSNVVFGFDPRCFGPFVGTDMLHLYPKSCTLVMFQ
jgi:hypothetical protein